MTKNIDFQIQESQQTLTRINTKENIASHIIVKLLKTKNKVKILKGTRGDTLRIENQLSECHVTFHHNKMDVNRQQNDILKVLKEKIKCQLKILYIPQTFFKLSTK